jgi:ribosomal protein S18 acetylase RimI-like enzyme
MTSTTIGHIAGHVTIARLGPCDWQEFKLLRLQALATDPQAFLASYDDCRSWPDLIWREQLEAAAGGSESWLLFARRGHVLTGMIGAHLTEEPGVAEIGSVFVTPEARGHGLGAALMEAMLQELRGNRALGTARLHVNVAQAAAIHIYTCLGFAIAGYDREILGDGIAHTCHLMERSLRA